MKNSYEKIIVSVFAIVFGLLFCFPITIFDKKVEADINSDTKYSILETNYYDSSTTLSNLGIDEDEVYDFAPYDFASRTRKGKSWMPESFLFEDNALKDYQLDSLNLTNTDFYTLDISYYESEQSAINNFCLSMWMYFDTTNLRETVFTLVVDSSNKLEWRLTESSLNNLLKRTDGSVIDLNMFTSASSIPYGWVQVKLPFDTAIKTGVVTDSIDNPTAFLFQQFMVTQTKYEGSACHIAFYDIYVQETNRIDAITKSDQQDYTILDLNDIIHTRTYYINEYYDTFPTVRELFNCLWVGKTNYLSDVSTYKTNFNITVYDQSSTNTFLTFDYGAGDFFIEKTNYKIYYNFIIASNAIPVMTEQLNVKSFGSGIWFTTTNTEYIIGKEIKLYYVIDTAFEDYSVDINFTSSNPDVIEIIDCDNDKTKAYILIKAKSVGESTISIDFGSTRLELYGKEDTITNSDLKLTVIEETSSSDGTKIALWITFGALCAGLVAYAIYSIIKYRKLEIK